MGSFDQNRSVVISGHPTGVSRTASNLDQIVKNLIYLANLPAAKGRRCLQKRLAKASLCQE
jgi:malonyl CoA-acyl carrier protein transacylase